MVLISLLVTLNLFHSEQVNVSWEYLDITVYHITIKVYNCITVFRYPVKVLHCFLNHLIVEGCIGKNHHTKKKLQNGEFISLKTGI